MQDIGETTQAIIEDDNKQLEAILNANKHRTEPYWIVLFAKAAKGYVGNAPALVKHFKAYGKKPISQVGAVIGEVNPKKGTIQWEVNMPDVPLDEKGIHSLGGKPSDKPIIETTTIPQAYMAK